MAKSLILWLLCDGKPGHENQALGLAEAIKRRISVEIEQIELLGKRGMISQIHAADAVARLLPPPDFILAAGHTTHAALFWLSRKYNAPSIVLMRPSLPAALFDHIIAPEHDYNNAPKTENIFLTKGAINRVMPSNGRREGKLILIGGPSKIHGWNQQGLIAMLAKITDRGGWELTDSRRTPVGFIDCVRARLPDIKIHPHQETGSEWIIEILGRAKEVWVTEDSVSMIYESLSGGAKVGLLPVPRLKKNARVLRGIEGLIADGYVTPYEKWLNTQHLMEAPHVLREADRCANKLIGTSPKT